jgi:hypothetical protein
MYTTCDMRHATTNAERRSARKRGGGGGETSEMVDMYQ